MPDSCQPLSTPLRIGLPLSFDRVGQERVPRQVEEVGAILVANAVGAALVERVALAVLVTERALGAGEGVGGEVLHRAATTGGSA